MTHPNVHYIGPLADAADFLASHIAPPAVVLTLGAGDGYKVGEWLLEKLSG